MTVPLYYHVPVVLALLALQCSTVYWAIRKIRGLQAGLLAKKVLLDGVRLKASTQTLAPGETFNLVGANNQTILIAENVGGLTVVRTFDDA